MRFILKYKVWFSHKHNIILHWHFGLKEKERMCTGTVIAMCSEIIRNKFRTPSVQRNVSQIVKSKFIVRYIFTGFTGLHFTRCVTAFLRNNYDGTELTKSLSQCTYRIRCPTSLGYSNWYLKCSSTGPAWSAAACVCTTPDVAVSSSTWLHTGTKATVDLWRTSVTVD